MINLPLKQQTNLKSGNILPEKEALTTGIKLWQFIIGLGGTVLPIVYFFGVKTKSFEDADTKQSENHILLAKRVASLESASFITLPHHDNLQKICRQDIESGFSEKMHDIAIKNQETVTEIKLDIRDMKSDIRSICALIKERES